MSTTYKKLKYTEGGVTYNTATEVAIKDGSGNNIATSLSNKQDTISDLATIRSGASLGATALQSVPNTYRTSAAQDLIDATKQGVLTEGTGIEISSDVIGVDTDTVALKTDLPTGTLDVNFNGTATQTTQTLTNIVAGTTTYTVPQGSTYTAGNGIDITNNQISLDSSVTFPGNYSVTSGSNSKISLQSGNNEICLDSVDDEIYLFNTHDTSKVDGIIVSSGRIKISSANIDSGYAYIEAMGNLYYDETDLGTSTLMCGDNILVHSKTSSPDIYRGIYNIGNQSPISQLIGDGAHVGEFDWIHGTFSYIAPTADTNIAVKKYVDDKTSVIASASTLGGVKVGNGLSIDANGVLSVSLTNANTEVF